MLNRKALFIAPALALLLLAGCGSSGDIFGGGNRPSNYPNGTYNSEIRGTVDSVDPQSRSIWLTNTNGMASSSGGGVRVYFDDRTTVDYNGARYRPEDLERGDEVAVRASQSGNRLVADAVTVTYNASANNGNTNYPNNNYPNNGGVYATTLSGTVRSVNTSNRTLQLDRGYGSTVTVEYDNSTPVLYNGRSYRISDLQRGDQIDVRGRDLGNGRYVAQNIDVVRSVSSNGNGTYGGTQSSYATIRGTVRSVDTYNHTITLDQSNWVSGFNPGAGNGNTVVVRYDNNVSVDVNGKLNPVTGLERGDVVEVQADNAGGSSLLARRITLVRDVRR
jgi:hypothetical protein